MVSAVVSAAMMLASASSLALSANASLLPLPTYEAKVQLTPRSAEELKAVKLGEIIDGLKYSKDVIEDVAWEDLTDEQKNNYLQENGLISTEEAASPATPTEITTDNPDHDVDLDHPDSVEITTHKAGDKVEVAADAKFVWIDGEKYSILDREAEVDVYKYGGSGTEFSRTFNIIIGSGKQLDPGNIIYEAQIAMTEDKAVFDCSVSFYTMNGEEKVALTATKKYENSYSDYDSLRYELDDMFNYSDKDIYVDITATAKNSVTGEAIDGEITVSFSRNSVNTDNKMRNSSTSKYRYAYLTITYTGADGQEKVETREVDIYLDTLRIEFSTYTKGSTENAWNYNSYSSSEWTSTGDFQYSYTHRGMFASGTTEAALRISSSYLCGHYLHTSNTKAYIGKYSTLEEVAELEDVLNTLKSSTGYTFTLGESLDITFVVDGDKLKYNLPALAGKTVFINYTMNPVFYRVSGDDDETVDTNDIPIYDPENEYFLLEDVKDTDGNSISNIDIPKEYDSYFMSHYQTRLIYDAENTIDMSKIMLEVDSPAGVNVYNSTKSNLVNFEKEPQDFTNNTVQYSVAASTGTGNYFVTLVKNTTNGANLFVNGPDEREVFLDSYYDEYHDILIANIGNAPLTGLKIEWVEEPVNIKIDEYWTIGGEKNDTLAAFTTTENPANLAKIRLIPTSEEGGDIKGTLKISADNGQSRTIKLTGHAGDPKIVTESPVVQGVKFVPYNAIIATDNVHKWIDVSYDMYYGNLPEGVGFNTVTGEIYGVPQETGKFTFYVEAYFRAPSRTTYDSKRFDLEVLDNTNMNVYMASDEDYTIQTAIGVEQTADEYDFVLDLSELDNDQLFVSNGVYGDFIDLWINGERLIADVDYTSESGSTRITIKAQTLKKLPQKETITLAAEFRVDGNLKNDLKRTAQNFKIDISEVHDNSKPSGGGSGSGSGSGSIVYPGGGGSHVPSLPDDEENTSHITTGNNHNHVELSDTAANSTAIKLAIALINKISTDPALINPDDVAAARAAYDKLPADSKSAVTNYDKLVAAEEAIKASVPAEEPPADTDNTPAETEDTPAETEETPAETEETPAETEDAPAETEDAPAEAEGVEFSARIVDAEGNPYANIYVELHSVVQTAYTDDDGCFAFDSVEYGEHTLTVTDEATGETASITFVISDDETEIFMDLMFDGSELTMLSGAEDGSDDNTDSDPADSTDNTGSADVDDDYDNVPTGISGSAVCLVLSSAAFVITLLPKKKRED